MPFGDFIDNVEKTAAKIKAAAQQPTKKLSQDEGLAAVNKWREGVAKTYGLSANIAMDTWAQDKTKKMGWDFKMDEAGNPMVEATTDGKLYIDGQEIKNAERLRKYILMSPQSDNK